MRSAVALFAACLWALPTLAGAAQTTQVDALTVTAPKGPFPVAPTRDAIFNAAKIGGGFTPLGPAGGFYPDRAARAGVGGSALIECTLLASGQLTACESEGETPHDSQFADAALKMASLGAITAQPRIVDGQPVASELVLVLVPFQLKPNR